MATKLKMFKIKASTIFQLKNFLHYSINTWRFHFQINQREILISFLLLLLFFNNTLGLLEAAYTMQSNPSTDSGLAPSGPGNVVRPYAEAAAASDSSVKVPSNPNTAPHGNTDLVRQRKGYPEIPRLNLSNDAQPPISDGRLVVRLRGLTAIVGAIAAAVIGSRG